MKYKKQLMWGLLALALVLTSCQPLPDSPIEPSSEPQVEPEVVETLAVEPTEKADPPSAPAEGGYQEGFTEQGYPFKGNPAAPVVIEEFSSYQCPFCGRYFQETYSQVMANYVETEKVLYVFRDFPLPSQPQSPLAAEAARCAGQTGGGSAYWAMHDRLLGQQREWSGRGDADTVFKGYAEEMELDTDTFNECLDSRATRAQVEADVAEGGRRSVQSTPTFLINGQPLIGAQPYAAFVQAIDAALTGEAPAAAEPSAPTTGPTPAAIAPSDDALIMGDPNAPVTIVEFSDFQCPFCARYFQETWSQLKTEFVDTGRVRYVFKDFPIISIHPQAPKAHEAARCAGDQGEYWTMHDRIFAGQSEWSGRSDHVAVFKSYAAELGLETSDFDTCLDSGRWASAVNVDLAEGASLGVSGTPTFFIDGYPLIGAQPYETFQYAIGLAEQGTLDEAYQQQSAPPPSEEDTTLKLAAVSELSPEIQQLPPKVQEAYRFALANPDVLSKIPCYCGCGSVGHMNNRMCYVQSESADRQVVFDNHAMG